MRFYFASLIALFIPDVIGAIVISSKYPTLILPVLAYSYLSWLKTLGLTTQSSLLISSSIITLKLVTKSETLLPMGPSVALIYFNELKLSGSSTLFPYKLVLSHVGLNAIVPVNADGTLKLPAKSPAKDNGTHLADTKPASPPLLPATDLDLSNGFSAVPQIGFDVKMSSRP